MQAYDAARAAAGRRWVSVIEFMEALLPASKYAVLRESVPTTLPTSSTTSGCDTFEGIFKDYGLWFNHVIKIERRELISVDYLWRFVTRGAMILCATNQEGIDIVLPVHLTTQTLGPESVTAIVIQVKNTKDHKTEIKKRLFDAMDSVVRRVIFSSFGADFDCVPDSDSDSDSLLVEPKNKKRKATAAAEETLEATMVKPKPVIRLVFALGSPDPSVVFKELSNEPGNDLTTFDIWLGGLSCETFKQIKEEDLESYKTLLERSLMPRDAFILGDVANIGKEARELRLRYRQMMAPLTLPGRSHQGIHLPPPTETGEGPS
jgi:hypothetical protein